MAHIYNNGNLKLKRRDLRNDMPQSERILWYHLQGKNLKNYKFRRQYSVGDYILDFYCPVLRLAIEIDGDSHFMGIHAKNYDQRREKFLTKQNIRIIHFTNSDIVGNITVVLDKILECLP